MLQYVFRVYHFDERLSVYLAGVYRVHLLHKNFGPSCALIKCRLTCCVVVVSEKKKPLTKTDIGLPTEFEFVLVVLPLLIFIANLKRLTGSYYSTSIGQRLDNIGQRLFLQFVKLIYAEITVTYITRIM